MGRTARRVTADETTRKRLLEVSCSRSATAGEVQRARIILGCLAGDALT